MDTKNLVVGQDVYMVSGCYACWGKVVEVTPEGAVVRTEMQSNITGLGELLRFDTSGIGCDGKGTYECGPWELDDTHPEEFAALLDYKRKEKAKLKPLSKD